MSENKNVTRTVYCEDAILWLTQNEVPKDCSLIASMPDISEFHGYTLAMWEKWFVDTATLVLSKTPENGVTIFYQSDIKIDGTWVDKGYLCQKAAEVLGHALLWHKIVCRVKPGIATFGRPAYSHVLCFSKELRLTDLSRSTPDVIPDIGDKTWERGMGFEACMMIGKFVAEHTPSTTLVHPFCGQGAMLAMANHFGLNAIGIERSPKRAEMAKTLMVEESKFMKKILFLVFITFSLSITANEKSHCKYGNSPVCGQPPMPECPKGLACIQVMPAQKNYSNRCEMEKAKAYLVSEGACLDSMVEPLKKNILKEN